MKENLVRNNNIEIRKSSIHGYGVFAKDYIKKRQIIEDCYFIHAHNCELKKDINTEEDWINKKLMEYVFGVTIPGIGEVNVLALGVGSIFNHSTNRNNMNVIYNIDIENRIITFIASKDIKKDEELLFHYGKGTVTESPYSNLYKGSRSSRLNTSVSQTSPMESIEFTGI